MPVVSLVSVQKSVLLQHLKSTKHVKGKKLLASNQFKKTQHTDIIQEKIQLEM